MGETVVAAGVEEESQSGALEQARAEFQRQFGSGLMGEAMTDIRNILENRFTELCKPQEEACFALGTQYVPMWSEADGDKYWNQLKEVVKIGLWYEMAGERFVHRGESEDRVMFELAYRTVCGETNDHEVLRTVTKSLNGIGRRGIMAKWKKRKAKTKSLYESESESRPYYAQVDIFKQEEEEQMTKVLEQLCEHDWSVKS